MRRTAKCKAAFNISVLARYPCLIEKSIYFVVYFCNHMFICCDKYLVLLLSVYRFTVGIKSFQSGFRQFPDLPVNDP